MAALRWRNVGHKNSARLAWSMPGLDDLERVSEIRTDFVEFDFKRSSRICSVTGQPIGRGEHFFSVLVERGEELVREDVSAAAWQGPPENCLGWWRSQVPDLEKGRVYWAPNDVLMAYFQHVLAIPEQSATAYVMALLLVRKRMLQWRETTERDGRNWLKLHEAKSNQNFEVAEVSLTQSQLRQIQMELAQKLFTDVRETEMSETE